MATRCVMVNNWGDRSARAERLTPEFYRLRPIVLRRDSNTCQWPDDDDVQFINHPIHENPLPPICGMHATHVDHIIPSGEDSLTNLWALCAYHHRRKTAQEGNAARWQYREQHPKERHSGIARD